MILQISLQEQLSGSDKVLLISLVFIYGCRGNYRIFPFKLIKDTKDLIWKPQKSSANYFSRRPEVSQHKIIQAKNGIVMFGDSLSKAGLWAELLFPKKVFNRGVDGDRLSHMLLRLNYIVDEAKVVFIQGGINDLLEIEVLTK